MTFLSRRSLCVSLALALGSFAARAAAQQADAPQAFVGRGRPGYVAAVRPAAPLSIAAVQSPAATITVTDTTDTIHSPGCATTGTGACSLRDAVLFANGHAGSTIIFAPSTDFIPITLSRIGDDDNAQNGDLDVTAALTITGNGPTNTIIQGGTNATNGVDKIFSFNPLGSFSGFAVTLTGVTLQFGKNPDAFVSNNGEGGAFDFDAGPSGTGSLTVANCVIQNNSTVDGDGGGIALFDGGTVSITTTTFSGNTVNTNSGASLEGGGVFIGFSSAPTNFTISGCTISGNKTNAGEGGGLKDFGGAATTYAMHGCTVATNTANSRGGGLALGATWTIDQGTVISGNLSTGNGGGAGEGGGIYFSASATANVSNVTIVNNVVSLSGADQRGGGGIAVGAGTLNVSDSRIVSNTAASGSGLHKDANAGTANAVDNWWGCNAGPGAPGCDTAVSSGGTLLFNPWLVLAISASPGVVKAGGTSSLTATLNKNSNNTTGFGVPDGTPISFGGTLGTSAPPTAGLSSSTASATFTAGVTPGNGSGTATVDNQTVSAPIVILVPPSITKSFVPATVAINADSALTFQITNPNTIAIDASFTDSLPAGLAVSPTPSVTNTCGGSVTAVAGASSVSFSNASLPVGTCTVSVHVRGTADGVYSNSVTIDSTAAGNGNLASAFLTVINPPSIGKVFGNATIPANGATSLTLTVSNSNVNSALTGLAFTDSLPSGLVVATPGNLTSTCTGSTTAPDGSGAVSLTGASLAAGSSCTVSVTVLGTTAGLKNNSVTVTSGNGGTGNTALASITVVAPPTLGKLFGAGSIALNASTSLTFNVGNPNASAALNGVAFNDLLPSGLIVATPNGLSGSCGTGTILATAGSSSVSLSNGTLAAGGNCSFSVNVTGSTPGDKNNLTSNITSTEGGTGLTASASVNVVAPPTISKAFGATDIAVNGTTSLTFTLSNPGGNTVAEAGVAFADSLPSGLVVATPNGLSNTCAGAPGATAGSGSVTLTGGAIAVNGSCTMAVNVTATTTGTKTNTTGVVSSTNGGTGATSNTAVLTVDLPPTISKAFGAATIPVNGTTSLTFTIQNPNAAAAASGVALTDNLPAGLAVATPNGLSNTCGGTATAVAGSGTVTLTGGTLAAGASCTLAVNVAGTTAGVKNNTVTVSSTEGGAGTPGNASITVVAPPTIVKSFTPPSINLNGTSTLTLSISNPNATVGLTGVAVTDNLPSGLVVSTPNGLSNTCGGTATATAGSASVSLSGGSLSAGGACALSVSVTATTAGSKVNTTGTVSSTEGGTGLTGTATLSVAAPDLAIAKAHLGNFTQGQTGAVYTITVSNLTAVSTLGTVTVTDALPSGLTATAFTGPGWTCQPLPALNCSRSDTLAGSGSYPVLTLTVNVASNAPASVVNSATVSGGGELNSGNDTANDPTTIDCGTTTATAGPAQTICTLGSTTPLGGNTPTIGTGTWSVVSGGTGTFSNATDPNATFTHVSGAGPILLRWTISNPPCPDSTADVTVTVTACSAAALAVDAAGNGVFEPGEAVVVSPTWSNTGATPVALSGTASNFTGPSGPLYTIVDATADYGTIAAGASASCASATANCYQLAVSVPPSRPIAHWDATFDETLSHGGVKTWVLHIGNTFADVPPSAPFYRFVENLVHNNVTGGCGPGSYCPADPVTRAQAAVFLVKSRYGAAYVPPPATGTVFNDVSASFFAAAFIEKIAADGVTAGCGGGSYCPNIPLTRAQMAVFLLREKFGSSYVPPPATGTVFNDVPASSFAAAYIEQLAALGISSGCGGGNYCPGSSVTRGQVAVFLTTTYTLVLYGP